MQKQKSWNKINLCKMRTNTEHGQWIRVIHIGILDGRLKELNGYDEILWHLITLMKKKPLFSQKV
jgi:hypothetical protein